MTTEELHNKLLVVRRTEPPFRDARKLVVPTAASISLAPAREGAEKGVFWTYIQ